MAVSEVVVYVAGRSLRLGVTAWLRCVVVSVLLFAVVGGGSLLVASLRVRPALGRARSLTPAEPATSMRNAADDGTSATSAASTAGNCSELPPTTDGGTPRWDVELTFTIAGDVVVHVGANPPEFSWPSVRPDTRPSASTIVSSQVYTGFALRNIRSSLEGLAWTLTPPTPEECQKLQATSGQRLTMQLPDTLPQGHFTHSVRFDVVPDFLQVKLAPYEIASSAAGLYRLQIDVPATAPTGNYQENNAAQLTIHFAHPRIAELKLRIHLAVARHLAATP